MPKFSTPLGVGTRPSVPNPLSGGSKVVLALGDGGPGAAGLVIYTTSGHRLRRARHGVITSARLVTEQLQDIPHRWAFVTLTYRPYEAWGPRHISDYVKDLRRWCSAHEFSCAYVWVAELQERGAVHYHLIVWWWSAPGRNVYLGNLPMPDRSGMWEHGSSRIETPRNPVGYMAKYCSKGTRRGAHGASGASDSAPLLPWGLRVWGCGGLGGPQQLELRWWRAPRWLRKFVPLEHGVKRLRHGWWGNLSTRWAYRTPWRFDMDVMRPYWVGWCWDDVCVDGSAFRELSGSG